MAKEMPTIVRESLRSIRDHVHSAEDNLSELLTGAPEEEWAGRMGFVFNDLACAQGSLVEALRYWAEHVTDR